MLCLFYENHIKISNFCLVVKVSACGARKPGFNSGCDQKNMCFLFLFSLKFTKKFHLILHKMSLNDFLENF